MLLFAGLFVLANCVSAQKKPLDHSVYDGWQSIGERKISPDGKWVVYTVNPQEGDGKLVIQSANGAYSKTIDRGYNATIVADNKFLVFRVKPFFKDTREARIKKKSPADMPKDTLGVLLLGTDSIVRYTKFKTFRTPEKNSAWLAVHLDKAPADTAGRKRNGAAANPAVDSLKKVIDSLTLIINTQAESGKKKKRNRDEDALFSFAADSTLPNKRIEEGTELLLRNLFTGEEKKFQFINEFIFDEKGTVLVMEVTPNKKDSTSQLHINWLDLASGQTKTIFSKANDIKSYAFDKAGNQLGFIVEKDSSAKALQKFYHLYHYTKGADSAVWRANRFTTGIPSGFTISENANINFSENGHNMFFGTTPIRAPKDTTQVDFETARLDVWHYADDYLQPQQLKQMNTELNRSYMAVLSKDASAVLQLGSPELENVMLVDEGNAPFVLASTNKEGRIAAQWTGRSISKAYLVSLKDGSKQLVKDKHKGFFQVSPKGKFVVWYNLPDRQYYAYETATGTTRNISSKITFPLYDTEDDHPDDPPSFGLSGWFEEDAAVLINDMYDVWKVDPTGKTAPVAITGGVGRKNKTILRVVNFNREERFIKNNASLVLEAFNRTTKYGGFYKLSPNSKSPEELVMGPYSFSTPLKADSAEQYIVSRMNIKESPDVFSSNNLASFTKLSDLNPQQQDYNWLTVELVKWKMFDGKTAEGLLYKPEDFDPKKKYPVIFYFYEKNADGLYTYKTPAPSASTVNIAYFVSNGYIVFDPNIYYKTGQPGEDAYNSVVSAAQYLATMPWVNAKKMAIQGQSWGGYQVAYLVTRTNMFAAAGAGAPVANMTSAYGGIRWGTGLNRQFQYERTQSRIGATLWERPDLYIKNSPLFTANKVNTPLLIMHNDEDGAVPWYQGIEYFTALRRLGKKVWMLQYNGEDHNLVERRNRKDLSVRLGQFFDHYLKGKPAPVWMTKGVPAVDKGKTWGLEIE